MLAFALGKAANFGESIRRTGKEFIAVSSAMVHAITNLLPAFVTYSDSFYQAYIMTMNCAGLILAAVVGGMSYRLMWKQKMFVQGAGTAL